MTITLKNVSSALHRTLKKQAKQNKRSLNQEVITCLEQELGLKRPNKEKLLEDIADFREKLAARGFRPMTHKQLKAAIEEGRE